MDGPAGSPAYNTNTESVPREASAERWGTAGARLLSRGQRGCLCSKSATAHQMWTGSMVLSPQHWQPPVLQSAPQETRNKPGPRHDHKRQGHCSEEQGKEAPT